MCPALMCRCASTSMGGGERTRRLSLARAVDMYNVSHSASRERTLSRCFICVEARIAIDAAFILRRHWAAALLQMH